MESNNDHPLMLAGKMDCLPLVKSFDGFPFGDKSGWLLIACDTDRFLLVGHSDVLALGGDT